jgi:hypothetical protein
MKGVKRKTKAILSQVHGARKIQSNLRAEIRSHGFARMKHGFEIVVLIRVSSVAIRLDLCGLLKFSDGILSPNGALDYRHG